MNKEKHLATAENFDYFKARVGFWLKYLGLDLSWRVVVELEKERCDEGFGYCSANLPGRVATIWLCEDWGDWEFTNKAIDRTALHECLELFMSPMHILATSRYVSKDEIEKEQHCVIRTLEKLLR